MSATPLATLARSEIESTAMLSQRDVARSAAKVARIVAGSVPRPFAIASAESDVIGPFVVIVRKFSV